MFNGLHKDTSDCKTAGAEFGSVGPNTDQEIDLRKNCEFLLNQLCDVFLKWCDWKYLYAEDEARVATLNRISGQFFRMVQDALMESIILQLCRLIEKPSERSPSITIESIRRQAESLAQPESVDSLYRSIDEVRKTLKKWRDKKLAHNDRDCVVNSKYFDTTLRLSDIDNLIEVLLKILCVVIPEEIVLRPDTVGAERLVERLAAISGAEIPATGLAKPLPGEQ